MCPRRSSAGHASAAEPLIRKIDKRTARLGVIGLGYVGLPLAVEFAEAGFHVTGIDIDERRVRELNRGHSYIQDVPTAQLRKLVRSGHLTATTDFAVLRRMDSVNICVPTPLSKQRDPDVSYIVAASKEVARYFHRGMLVILESTTYPGTTDELILPLLAETGLEVGKDFFLAFSPERVDPGNATYTTINIPKVVGGVTPACTEVARNLYSQVMNKVVPVSSVRVAETVKLLENTFRSVNIAMVNELALMCAAMDIDVWEVIAGASTKPFGFMPFYPGPGLGGHCIPIDPFYLSWKAKQFGSEARFIELAGQINGAMPKHVVNLTARALNGRKKAVNGSRVLVVGVAYKPAIDDIRESPALDVIELLVKSGAEVSWYDPHVPSLPAGIHGERLDQWTKASLAGFDAAVIVTPHPSVDHKVLLGAGPVVIDSRNALKGERHPDLTRL